MNVTATHARQHFAALLERTIAGEEIAIERHGRLVARLVPAGPARMPHPILARGKVAEVRGVPPESAISRLFRERALRRLEIAHPRAEAAVAELGRRGVKARIVGSLARGSFRQTSDVDLLIDERGTLDEDTIESIVRGEMGDFPFDLLYADRLPATLKEHIVAGSKP
jgi:antitoxin (DNA-binding transcriptional repressor) of toxin-antitoxin stability system